MIQKNRNQLPGLFCQQLCFCVGFSGTCRRMADTTDIMSVQLVGMRNKIAGAFTTGDELHHTGFEKTHQKPGTRNTQNSFPPLDTVNLIKV